MTHANLKKIVDRNVVFLHHGVRFPVFQLPNKPEAFGLPANLNKNLLTLGRYKAIPDSVWIDVFGEWSETPIYRLGLVRSRLQAFIDKSTTEFMLGNFRALPMAKLDGFMKIASVLEQEFNSAKDDYAENLPTLKALSLAFWGNEAEKLFKIPSEDIVAAVDKILSAETRFHNAFGFITCAVTLDSLDTGAMSLVGSSSDVITQSINKMDEAMEKLLHDSVVGQREEIQAAFSELYEKVQSGKFNQKSVNAVKRVLNGFKEMNYMNDKALEAFVEDAYEKLEQLEIRKIKGKGQEKAFAEFSAYVATQKDAIDAMQEDGVDDVIDAFIGTNTKELVEDVDDEPEPF